MTCALATELSLWQNLALMDYGDVIRSHRNALGLSTEELADHVGVNKETVNRVELNRNPRIDTLRKIADGLHLSLATVFGEAEAAGWQEKHSERGSIQPSTSVIVPAHQVKEQEGGAADAPIVAAEDSVRELIQELKALRSELQEQREASVRLAMLAETPLSFEKTGQAGKAAPKRQHRHHKASR